MQRYGYIPAHPLGDIASSLRVNPSIQPFASQSPVFMLQVLQLSGQPVKLLNLFCYFLFLTRSKSICILNFGRVCLPLLIYMGEVGKAGQGETYFYLVSRLNC